MRQKQWESAQAAMALLLGPETTYHVRAQAVRRLVRQGPSVLPFVLNTLGKCAEITEPGWPWSPPQYEHCSRLLLLLSQASQINLEELAEQARQIPTAGPVLWTSIMETASLFPERDHEELLCQGLEMPWECVRYAAAQTLATRAKTVPLHPATRLVLRAHQHREETYPVRLTAAFALLTSGEEDGLELFQEFLKPATPLEVRRAATALLATELPASLTTTQRECLTTWLLYLLRENDAELVAHATHIVGAIALPSLLPTLCKMLELDERPQIQIAALTILEEIAPQDELRHLIRQQGIPASIVPFCRVSLPELRRQATYTLAVCGGEYGAAVLGTMVLTPSHPGHIEAIESLRVLHGALQSPLRTTIVRWLVRSVFQMEDEVQATALDSLTFLLKRAERQEDTTAQDEICREIVRAEIVTRCAGSTSVWVRQRIVGLLLHLGTYLEHINNLPAIIEQLLLKDNDPGVRASVASACGQFGVEWALPGLLLAVLDPDEDVAHNVLNALAMLATLNTPIVTSALRELTLYRQASDPASQRLAHRAHTILKKLQQAEQGKAGARLHSFGSCSML